MYWLFAAWVALDAVIWGVLYTRARIEIESLKANLREREDDLEAWASTARREAHAKAHALSLVPPTEPPDVAG